MNYVWWKKKLEGPTLKRSFFDETEVFGFWMVPAQLIVMFWVEWDSLLNSTGVAETFAAWRTHNSCVQLEHFYQKNDKLKRHEFPTKRRKLFLFGLWHATYQPMFPRVCEYQKMRMAAAPARIPPNGWKGSFWLRRQKLYTEATIISLAWAGGRNFTQPAGIYI